MKISLSDDSDRSWEYYGSNDPYFGVLTDQRFRRDRLTDATIAEFFASGETHIEASLDLIRGHFPGELGGGGHLISDAAPGAS